MFGLQRSGTTQAWNLLQSQAGTLWPAGELHQILRPNSQLLKHQKRPVYTSLQYLRVLSRSGDLLNFHKEIRPGRLAKHAEWLQQGLKRAISENTGQRDRFRHGLLHDGEAPERLLVKVMNYGIALAPDILKIYPNATFIVVLRDLVAVCEGHLARGQDPETVLDLCYEFTERCESLMGLPAPVHAFSFEEYLGDPQKAALKLLAGAGFQTSRDDEIVIQDRIRVQDQANGHFRSESINRRLRIRELSDHVRRDVNDASRRRLGEEMERHLSKRLARASARQLRFIEEHSSVQDA